MCCPATFEAEGTWLNAADYSVLALNDKLTQHLPEITEALSNGAPTNPDPAREGFYDVELSGGWAYINVRDESRTVYVVAFRRGKVAKARAV